MRRAMTQVLLVLALLAGIAISFYFARRYVDKKVAFPTEPPRVVLKIRPPWMTDFLAEQIIRSARPAGTRSAFDQKLLVETATLLKGNPWIREVRQVRRVYGQKPGDTIEIDCAYRAPIALVKWGDYYSLIDGEATKLPEQFTAQQVPQIVMGPDRKTTNIRIVEGVKQPPPEPGRTWAGADVDAGLDMVKLLYGKPYANEVMKVDVSNFDGRRDPREAQLVLITKHSTEIRWGRPVNAKDFFIEVSTAQKLEYMKKVFEELGRVDGNRPWIDIRFDKITYPSSEADVQSAGAR
jgi:hypothetical protein